MKIPKQKTEDADVLQAENEKDAKRSADLGTKEPFVDVTWEPVEDDTKTDAE